LNGATVNGTLKADVAAVAPYFSLDIDQLYQKHLQGTVNLNDVFAELRANIDSTMQLAAENKQIAAARGLPLVSYEGGQHLVARPGEQQNNQAFVDLLSQINRDGRMADLYAHMLDEWYRIGGKTFVFAADIGPSSKWGSWGLQESYLDTQAAKFQAVQQYLQRLNAANPADLNRDGATNSLDFNYWKQVYGDRWQLNADISRNGIIDASDYVLFRKGLAQLNVTTSMIASAIPEPHTIALTIGALSIGLLDNRRLYARL
jgi:hypothetical protein